MDEFGDEEVAPGRVRGRRGRRSSWTSLERYGRGEQEGRRGKMLQGGSARRGSCEEGVRGGGAARRGCEEVVRGGGAGRDVM